MKATILFIGSVAVTNGVKLQRDHFNLIQREPLLTWAPTPHPSPYPVDYAVPNFGVDHDIASTAAHTAKAEGTLGKWTPK